MVSIFFDYFQGFVLSRAELMLTFFEDGLELGPEAILEMGKLEVFIGFVLSGARNFDSLFFIDDTAFGMS